MNIEPVKKTNKSGDKRQQQGKKKQQRKFLNNFRQTLDKYRRRKITKNKSNIKQKKYKSKSLQEEIYKREVAKNMAYSKVYHTLNKKEQAKGKSQTIKNQRVATNRNNKKISHARTMSKSKRYYGTTKKYRGRSAYTSTTNTYNSRNKLKQSPSAKVQNTQSVKTKKRTQNIKNKSTAKVAKQKSSPIKRAKTTKSEHISSKPQKPQQLMRSVQKSTKRRVQHPTNSIEKMLGEYGQAYRKSGNLNKNNTRKNKKDLEKVSQPKKQNPTKKEEVQQFKKGIANTRKTTKDIAYREYEKYQYRRVAMQRRMRNSDRKKEGKER